MGAEQSAPVRVVIGVGNPYRHDDGVGPEVANLLRQRLPPEIGVVDHDGEPAGLLTAWEGAAVAILIDAVRSPASTPGQVHRLAIDGSGAWKPVRTVSSHSLDPGDVVELARALDRLPEHLVIYGVEGRDFTPGTGLSPEVEASLDAVVEAILKEVAP